MNTQTNTQMDSPLDPPVSSTQVASSRADVTRPFYWAVKRELWEHRALYFAPLITAAIVLLGFLAGTRHIDDGMRLLDTLPADQQRVVLGALFGSIVPLIVLVMSVAVWVYCLDALHAERRDRSILFWKSLPVSDTTTVLSKLFIPSVAVPVIIVAVVLAAQLFMLIYSTVVLLVGGVSITPLWTRLPLLQISLTLVYVLAIMAVWFAPVHAWLLLMSATVRRLPFFWAVMPPLAVAFLERALFGTTHVGSLLSYRMFGFMESLSARTNASDVIIGDNAINANITIADFSDLPNPLELLANPHVWIGLLVAAALTAGAIWMRRYREPL